MNNLDELTYMRKTRHRLFEIFDSKFYDKYLELEDVAYAEGQVSRNKISFSWVL